MNEVLDKNIKDEQEHEDLRPKTLKEYIGQETVKKNVGIFIESAKKRNAVLDHILFYGPPGLGKTTIACIIANEMNADIKTTTGPSIQKAGDLVSMLLNLKDGDIFFIDEIHRLNKNVEEILYPAMEDYFIDIITDNTDEDSHIKIPLPKFTLVGATTKAGLLSPPLRDRFGSLNKLENYSQAELEQIVNRDAKLLDIKIDKKASMELAKRARGTPRIAIRLLKRIRDFAVVNDSSITIDITKEGLESLGIDSFGLDIIDTQILLALQNVFKGGPVGLNTLSAYIGEDSGTIEDISEPFLIQMGLIQKTSKGRMLTDKGIKYVKKMI